MSDEPAAEESARLRPGVGSDPAVDPAVAETEIEERYLASVDQGRRRLSRRGVALAATGAVGGIDVGIGVLALFLVEKQTGSKLLGGLAFSIGFVILTFARSELFTEDFLIPVVTVMSRQARLHRLLRLWVGTLVANLVAGWVFMYIVVRALPQLDSAAIAGGTYYIHIGHGVRSFCLAVLGGVVITLMTWMQQATESIAARAIPAVMVGFLLGAARLNHVIVASLVVFAALQAGHRSFGYLAWFESAMWAALGNVVGGVVLVTMMRLLQVPHRLKEERRSPAPGVAIGDHRKASPVPDG